MVKKKIQCIINDYLNLLIYISNWYFKDVSFQTYDINSQDN